MSCASCQKKQMKREWLMPATPRVRVEVPAGVLAELKAVVRQWRRALLSWRSYIEALPLGALRQAHLNNWQVLERQATALEQRVLRG